MNSTNDDDWTQEAGTVSPPSPPLTAAGLTVSQLLQEFANWYGADAPSIVLLILAALVGRTDYSLRIILSGRQENLRALVRAAISFLPADWTPALESEANTSGARLAIDYRIGPQVLGAAELSPSFRPPSRIILNLTTDRTSRFVDTGAIELAIDDPPASVRFRAELAARRYTVDGAAEECRRTDFARLLVAQLKQRVPTGGIVQRKALVIPAGERPAIYLPQLVDQINRLACAVGFFECQPDGDCVVQAPVGTIETAVHLLLHAKAMEHPFGVHRADIDLLRWLDLMDLQGAGATITEIRDRLNSGEFREQVRHRAAENEEFPTFDSGRLYQDHQVRRALKRLLEVGFVVRENATYSRRWRVADVWRRFTGGNLLRQLAPAGSDGPVSNQQALTPPVVRSQTLNLSGDGVTNDSI